MSYQVSGRVDVASPTAVCVTALYSFVLPGQSLPEAQSQLASALPAYLGKLYALPSPPRMCREVISATTHVRAYTFYWPADGQVANNPNDVLDPNFGQVLKNRLTISPAAQLVFNGRYAPNDPGLALDFQGVRIGSSPQSLTLTITKTGSDPLTIWGVELLNLPPDRFTFKITHNGAAIAPPLEVDQQPVVITVTFTPTPADAGQKFDGSLGMYTTDARYAVNDPIDPPIKVPVSGVGTTPPMLSVDPSTYSFGWVWVNSQKDSFPPLTIKNTGTDPATLTFDAPSGFEVVAGTPLAPVSNQEIEGTLSQPSSQPITLPVTVRFAPTNTRQRGGDLKITPQDTKNPTNQQLQQLMVSVTGFGVIRAWVVYPLVISIWNRIKAWVSKGSRTE